jgi:CO/xanthine dehydrogenase FAD-binding subunit
VKPAPFAYHRPRSREEVDRLLAELGPEAKLLAGGQSLIPILNMRLAAPAHVIDLNFLEDEPAEPLARDGAVSFGPLVRMSAAERSPLVAERLPLLAAALPYVGHPAIRSRGTLVGSIAHADPAAELPVASAALDARFHVRSTRGSRTLEWRDFFVTHLTTALEPDELLVEVDVPPVPEGSGWAFTEFSRRHGDFALGGAAVLLSMDDGHCREARIALLGAADTPLRPDAAERGLAGSPVEEQSAAEAGATAVAGLEPTGDIHGGSEYRKHLIEAMVRRAVLEAAGRARR